MFLYVIQQRVSLGLHLESTNLEFPISWLVSVCMYVEGGGDDKSDSA